MARILIVEDYESLQDIYATVLRQEGYDVVMAGDGNVALEKTSKFHFDLILLDLLLPHMSGLEFLHAFKPKQHLDTKVIVFSNFTNPKFTEEALELGAAKHLTKSNLSPKEVVDVIATTLKEP